MEFTTERDGSPAVHFEDVGEIQDAFEEAMPAIKASIKPADDPLRDTLTEHLKCMLTVEEKAKYGEDAGRLRAQAERELDAEKKRNKNEKTRIEGISLKAKRLETANVNGWELRDVECLVVYNLRARSRTITRTDTGETVRVEQLTQAEFEDKARCESHWKTKSMRFFDPVSGEKLDERPYTQTELEAEERVRQTELPGMGAEEPESESEDVDGSPAEEPEPDDSEAPDMALLTAIDAGLLHMIEGTDDRPIRNALNENLKKANATWPSLRWMGTSMQSGRKNKTQKKKWAEGVRKALTAVIAELGSA